MNTVTTGGPDTAGAVSGPRSTLRGCSLVEGRPVVGTAGTIAAVDPATGTRLDPSYSLLSTSQLHDATAAADDAFASYRALDPHTRAAFLDRIAERMERVGDDIVARAHRETGLPVPRLAGELARTTGQLRMFADVVRRGDYRDVRIDPARPDRTPAPRVDIREQKIPVGPVAVFGSSNFPLAFSTAGGDTASALAAGCPVVFKAHGAHPGTGELVGRAITDAARDTGVHPGVFSLVYGPGTQIGQALVADPVIQAVGFTGSRGGGLALCATAAARPQPIPVYAEMSSINPVIVLPGALGDGSDALAAGYVGSVTGSSGQLCTVPGLLFVPDGPAGDRFTELVADTLAGTVGQTMLTAHIRHAWQTGVDTLAGQRDVAALASGVPGDGDNAPAPRIFQTTAAAFTANPVLQDEIFGAASLVIRYGDTHALHDAVAVVEGQLTATLHLDDTDHNAAAALLPLLERKAGRIVVNGWPTGVEVGHAMVHGGPFPATSDVRSTSVGSLAIDRFLRPVAYQNMPAALLPPALQPGNPWNLTRRIDGVLTAEGRA